MNERKLTLWTTWCEYGATGEGYAVMARVSGAYDEQQCRDAFAAAFGEFYAIGCEVEPGVVRNRITELLWSPKLLDFLDTCKNPAAVEAKGQLYANFS